MNNQYKDPEYHKKYYQEHKAEIAAKRKERYKRAKEKEYKHNYYMANREEIKAKQKARYAVKKANKNACITLKTPENEVYAQVPKIQDVYIHDSFSKQLERIINVLWWIAFAISFVGVAVLFK